MYEALDDRLVDGKAPLLHTKEGTNRKYCYMHVAVMCTLHEGFEVADLFI